jgi:FAD/FMN-containing dehydrogenase
MPDGSRRLSDAAKALDERSVGGVRTDDETLVAMSRDFGGLVERRPRVVVRPEHVEGVLETLLVAKEHGLGVTTRGSGHSQSGQCLGGGIVLDMRGLDRIIDCDVEAGRIDVHAGATWWSLIDRATECGALPAGLTHVPNPTVGGTLSIGGVGAESFRRGAQVNGVLELEVATPDGNVRRCSPALNAELFDCARSGLGQCGIILRAVYPIRPSRPRVRCLCLLYRDAERFVRDIERVAMDGRAEFVTGTLEPDPDRPGSALSLVLGKEYASEAEIDEASLCADLGFMRRLPPSDVPVWNRDGVPGHLFFRRYDPPPGELPLHPWVDHLFSLDGAVGPLEQMLAGRVLPLRFGTSAVIPVARSGTPAPLLVTPPGNSLMIGLGVFPAVSSELRDPMTSIMVEHSAAWCEAGGVRYLSGFLDFRRPRDWALHFRHRWDWFRERKRRFDPDGLLNPGVVAWDDSEPVVSGGASRPG